MARRATLGSGLVETAPIQSDTPRRVGVDAGSPAVRVPGGLLIERRFSLGKRSTP